MSDHRGIPDEVVQRARLYDAEHWRADRAGERGGSWGSVPADQVRRLPFGAYGGAVPVILEDEPRPAAFFDDRDLSVVALHEEGGEEG